MATGLQQQLAAIAANSTHQLDLKAQKARHSKSLLFEPKDAATQDFDTIYQLCLEGFQELCQLDSRFRPFARNLFSEQSRSEDRAQMTAQENAELDRVIERFLGLLGGRLLLKPAMKAAEWIIRRFGAHENNTEALLLTFLPYHSSPIFPTLLSILPDRLPPNFRFLHPYVSSLQSPPRHAIVAAASNNSAFLTAFSQYVLNVARAKYESAILLRHWASVTVQAVSGMIDATRSGRETIRRQKEEDLLLKVLPILQNGLAIRGASELYLGLCMIIVILATKASLSEKVLDALMEAVAAGWNEETLYEGVTCLALLAEEKEEDSIPRVVLRAILKQDSFMDIVDRIGGKIRVERLLATASLGAVQLVADKQDARAHNLVLKVIKSQDLLDHYKMDILTELIKAARQPGTSEEARQEIQALLSTCAEDAENAGLIASAAQRANVSLAHLSLNLALQLEDAEDNNETHGELMILDDQENRDRPAPDFKELSNLPSEQASFLDLENGHLFDEYCSAFQKALPSKQDVSGLLELPALQKSACIKNPSALTFFARAWTSGAPNFVRMKALHITSELLREQQRSVDLQALLPYLIAALADPIKAIRLAAVSTCIATSSLYTSDAGKTKSAGDVGIWCKDSIYGKHSSEVRWLSSPDAHTFLSEAVLPILEDCVVDGNYIVQALTSVLDGSSAASGPERKELKSALRGSVYSFLASHVVVSPLSDFKIRLLAILNKVGKAVGSARTQILLPYIKSFLDQAEEETISAGTLGLSKALIANVTHQTTGELQYLMALASAEVSGVPSLFSTLAFDRLTQLWSSMQEAARADIVNWLLELSLTGSSSEAKQSQAIEMLKNLTLPTQILVRLVESLPTVSELQGASTPAKKQRTSRASETPKAGSVDKQKLNSAIRRISLVLELVEESKPERHPQLLKGLFHFLSEMHHFKVLLDSELVYLQGLLINSLLAVVNGLKDARGRQDIDRSAIRADLIVNCVRTTSNTQVHHAALLLMSSLASWAPDLVLHSVMPLFTFMSSTILKQGDDYSAHVTDQTVARIIPPLAASLKKRGKDLISGAADLLLSFTAAFEHIPLHRRSGLFQHLVQTLGAEESLFAIAAMLVERYPDDPSSGPFVGNLMDGFPVAIQLHAISQYLDLIFDTRKPKRTLPDAILGYAEKNVEQATKATATLLDGLAGILSRDPLRKKLAKELKKDHSEAEDLRIVYSKVLEKTMQLELQFKADEGLHDSADDVLTALLGLMPSKDFIDSSAKLMQTGSDEIRQQVFSSLEQRVNMAKRGDAATQQIFIDVLPNCALFVVKGQPVATRLAAITCIARIAEKFGKTDRTAVFQAAEQIATDSALGSKDASLRRMSLLCLASMIEVLEDEFIPILPGTLDKAIEYLDAALRAGKNDEESLATCFSFMIAVLDYIPWMLSGSYLDRIIGLAAQASEYPAAREFTALAAKKLPAQECLGTIDRMWDQVYDHGVEALQLLIETLNTAVQHHTKATIGKSAQVLFSILFKAFDLRRRLLQDEDEDEDEDTLSTLSELVNHTAMDSVLKLNDATFRPFFLRLGEWAFGGSSKDKAGMVHKATSYFSFTLVLFEQLKSIVTSYAGFLLENVASLLSSLSPDNEAERALLEIIVQTLSASFSHDQDGFWQTPSHFDAIAAPLSNRLASTSLSAEEVVIPSITELASAATSPELHKTLNSTLIQFMRHHDPLVRLAAVKTERSLTERLDIDWCHFIPEWVPFISELQEDDDGRVERETLRWMQQIQDVTGEDINDMMR